MNLTANRDGDRESNQDALTLNTKTTKAAWAARSSLRVLTARATQGFALAVRSRPFQLLQVANSSFQGLFSQGSFS